MIIAYFSVVNHPSVMINFNKFKYGFFAAFVAIKLVIKSDGFLSVQIGLVQGSRNMLPCFTVSTIGA